MSEKFPGIKYIYAKSYIIYSKMLHIYIYIAQERRQVFDFGEAKNLDINFQRKGGS